MSTFKRLFNVGRGKAKGVQRDVEEALGRTAESPGEWVDSARHKAADAAEALAGAIRPGDSDSPAAPESTASPVEASPQTKSPDPEAPTIDEPEEPVKAERSDPTKPKKRTL